MVVGRRRLSAACLALSSHGISPKMLRGVAKAVAHAEKTGDLYLLASGLDYPRALGDWASIGGAPSLPPLAALGIWCECLAKTWYLSVCSVVL